MLCMAEFKGSGGEDLVMVVVSLVMVEFEKKGKHRAELKNRIQILIPENALPLMHIREMLPFFIILPLDV